MGLLLYLGGPISGCSYDGCTNWRDYVTSKLPPIITAISPMRGKDYLESETQIKDCYTEHPLSGQKGIMTRDRFDVMRADALFMNFLGSTMVSIGSIIEIGWGDAFRKPIIIAMEEDNIHSHSMVREAGGFITPSLDEAIQIAIAILSPDAATINRYTNP